MPPVFSLIHRLCVSPGPLNTGFWEGAAHILEKSLEDLSFRKLRPRWPMACGGIAILKSTLGVAEAGAGGHKAAEGRWLQPRAPAGPVVIINSGESDQ